MKKLDKYGVEMHQATLRNGASAYLFRRTGMPIYLRVAFLAGSRFDVIPGTAHFLEHMLLAGTRKFPSKNLIADYIQSMGGEFGASTDPNVLRINIEIPLKEDLDVGIEILKECLTASLFDEKTIETERGAILSELKAKKSNPKENIWDVSHVLTMQGTPLAHSNLGSEDNIKSIGLEQLKDFHSRHIHSGRAVFIASGDIEIDELIKHLESIDIPRGDKFSLNEALPVVMDEMTKIEPYPTSQLQVIIASRIVPESYEEQCALQVLSNILAVGRGSRLMTKLRYERGLVYSVGGAAFYAGDWGLVRVNFSCDSKNLDEAKNIILEEFENLKKSGVTQSELDKTKAQISKGSIRHMQTSNSWIYSHEGEALYHSDSFKTVEDFVEDVAKVTNEDIMRIANKFLNKDQFFTSICGEV